MEDGTREGRCDKRSHKFKCGPNFRSTVFYKLCNYVLKYYFATHALHVSTYRNNHVCLLQKLYRALSEMKAEVESVIRSGRQAAGGAGGALGAELDALKELYNRLGAQVTDSKSRLESALLAARELHADLHALATWLDGLAANVGKQTLELEMSRMEAVRDKLNTNYAQFVEQCDAAQLAGLRERVEAVNARWEQLRRHGPSAPPASSAQPTPFTRSDEADSDADTELTVSLFFLCKSNLFTDNLIYSKGFKYFWIYLFYLLSVSESHHIQHNWNSIMSGICSLTGKINSNIILSYFAQLLETDALNFGVALCFG